MSLWRHLNYGLRNLLRRPARDRDVTDEVEQYFEEAEAELRSRGLSARDARRAARLEAGNMIVVKERVNSYGWENAARSFVGDLRYAVRQLRKHPVFTLTATLTLALGIGASTAIFSVLNPILFEPLPYPHPDKVMMLWEMRSDGLPLDVTFGTFHGLAEQNRSFEALAVMKAWQPAMVAEDKPERLEGQRVSADYFRTLGVEPVLGRDFAASDDRFHGPNVVILSDSLWRRRFGGDRSIVGRQVQLDGNLYTVAGVMPHSFEDVLASSAELWAPLQYDPSLPADGREWGHHLRMVGRLRAAVSKEQATSELDVILHTLAQRYAKGYDSSGGAPDGMIVNSLRSDMTRGVKPALLAVLSAVFLVLLIACVNVTNLLLARGAQRRAEFAMRAALGAAPERLVRQLLTESLLLAIVAGAVGMVVAVLGVHLLVALSPPELPRVSAMGVDGPVFLFAFGITTLIGVAVGLVPALQVSRKDLHLGMQQGSRRMAGGRQWMRRSLVVAEVSFAVVLLVSAGLLLRSLEHLFAIDPGFDASHLLTMQVQESGRKYDNSQAASLLFFQEALESVRHVPGVISAGFTSQLPLSGDYEEYGLQVEKDTNPGSDAALRYSVTPEYLETMHIPLLRGRLLNEHDGVGSPVVVLINESLAKRKFPGQDPIGQRIRVGPDVGHADRPWATIVGVVGDVKQTSLAVSEEDAFYIPTMQWPWADNVLTLVVRTRDDAAALAPEVRDAIWSVDKDQPIVRVSTMDRLLSDSESERRFVLILFEAFALAGLVLAATGIYGVLAGSVTERTREIGVRSALGASRGAILALVVRQGMTLTWIGILLGLSGAVVASQLLVTLLFGVSRLDPMTYLAVIALLLSASGVACFVPALRAASVDPVEALRAE